MLSDTYRERSGTYYYFTDTYTHTHTQYIDVPILFNDGPTSVCYRVRVCTRARSLTPKISSGTTRKWFPAETWAAGPETRADVRVSAARERRNTPNSPQDLTLVGYDVRLILKTGPEKRFTPVL